MLRAGLIELIILFRVKRVLLLIWTIHKKKGLSHFSEISNLSPGLQIRERTVMKRAPEEIVKILLQISDWLHRRSTHFLLSA
jgi:hypothetical protein